MIRLLIAETQDISEKNSAHSGMVNKFTHMQVISVFIVLPLILPLQIAPDTPPAASAAVNDIRNETEVSEYGHCRVIIMAAAPNELRESLRRWKNTAVCEILAMIHALSLIHI